MERNPTGSSEKRSALYSIEDIPRIDIQQATELYREYINSTQANIYSKLSFGRDIFVRAEGMYMYTKSGRQILDFTGGIGVLNHGHNHPRILAARVSFQNSLKMEVHKQVFSPYLAALSHNLASLLPGTLNKCFFPNSGAEAVEGALKLAYKYHNGKRDIVLHSNISFHGNLIGSGSISAASGYKQQFQVMQGVKEYKYNDIESVSAEITNNRCRSGSSNIYALIVEPFHASSLVGCSEDFLLDLRELCSKEDIVLIFDEIYTGWGKTGELFNFFRVDGLVPDILTMSKSFGGGKSSISCYVTVDSIFEAAYGDPNDALLHTSTYNGFGEECITAIEAINIILDEDYVGKSRNIGLRLTAGLTKLKEKYPSDIAEVRGDGCLIGLVLKSPLHIVEDLLLRLPNVFLKKKGSLLKKAAALSVMDYLYQRHGILTHINKDPDWVVFMITPSLIATEEQIYHFLNCLDDTLNQGLKTLVPQFLFKYVIR